MPRPSKEKKAEQDAARARLKARYDQELANMPTPEQEAAKQAEYAKQKAAQEERAKVASEAYRLAVAKQEAIEHEARAEEESRKWQKYAREEYERIRKEKAAKQL